MKKSEHTPTPWEIGPDLKSLDNAVYDSQKYLVADCNTDRMRRIKEECANAALIVRAVNSHDELLTIVKAIAESFNAGANQVYAEALAPHPDDETLKTWLNKAIAKAEEE